MPNYRTNSEPILAPDQIHELLVEPLTASAVATQTATTVQISSSTWRVPMITDDPSAAWVAEGAEIPASEAEFAEAEVTPSKLAALTIISRELSEDSSPEAGQVIGDALVRDLQRKLDQAFLGNLAAPAPAGLGSLVGTTGVLVGGTTFTDLDAFAAAQARAEELGTRITSWIASPDTALALSQLKVADGSNQPLIASVEAGTAARRGVNGLPLFVSPYCSDTVVYGVPSSRVFTIIREDARVDVDGSAYFSSDRIGVRATLRAGFAFPHPASVVKVLLDVPTP